MSDGTLPWPLVETNWLAEHLDDPDLRIIDCGVMMQMENGAPKFSSGLTAWQKNHIPNSVHVDIMSELSDKESALPMMMPALADFSETMGKLGVGKGAKVVLYDCTENAWAARVWWMLRAAGFESAAVLNGGWKKWSAEQHATSTDVTNYPRVQFVAKPKPALFVHKEEVLLATEDMSCCLINSLTPEIFAGKVSPFGRSGHIPSSLNVPVQAIVDSETNSYLAKQELQGFFTAAGFTSNKTERVITYCGGGIAASSNALALTVLGYENVAVYDGSMSEWASDPSLPLNTLA